MTVKIIEAVYSFLWGDLVTIPLANGDSIGIPLLVILLIPTGIFFTIRTKFLPIRKFPAMVKALGEKNEDKSSLSIFQTLIVSTATRVGMGNLVGVVAALSVGGAGAVFWMWVSAFLGASTAFVLRRCIKRRIRFMVVIMADLHITYMILLNRKEAKK